MKHVLLCLDSSSFPEQNVHVYQNVHQHTKICLDFQKVNFVVLAHPLTQFSSANMKKSQFFLFARNRGNYPCISFSIINYLRICMVLGIFDTIALM